MARLVLTYNLLSTAHDNTCRLISTHWSGWFYGDRW